MDRDALRARFKARGQALEAAVPFTAPGFGPVFIKLMSAARATANVEYLSGDNGLQRTINAAACVLCDEAGVLLYDPANVEDMAELAAVEMRVLTSIVQEATRLNAQSPEGVIEAGNG